MGGRGSEGRASGLRPGWSLPGPHGLPGAGKRGMFTFLEKNHINMLGDSYANKDKTWDLKPGKK